MTSDVLVGGCRTFDNSIQYQTYCQLLETARIATQKQTWKYMCVNMCNVQCSRSLPVFLIYNFLKSINPIFQLKFQKHFMRKFMAQLPPHIFQFIPYIRPLFLYSYARRGPF